MPDVLGVAAVLQLSGEVWSTCWQYLTAGAASKKLLIHDNAESDIKHLMDNISALQGLVQLVEGLVNSPDSTKLIEVNKVIESTSKLQEVFKNLLHVLGATQVTAGKRHKLLFWRLQKLKWPLQKENFEQTIQLFEQYKTSLIAAIRCGDPDIAIVNMAVPVQSEKQNTNLTKLPRADAAIHDHEHWKDADHCLQNTRVALRHQIMEWCSNPSSECIFWLNGMAGTGKSTISRTIAAELADRKRLAATFFFSRGRGDISNSSKFFPTLAAQLAAHLPVLRPFISNAIEKNPAIIEGRSGLREQWKELILNPLKNAPAESIQLVVVIDALDECDSMEDIQCILQLLAEAKDLDTVQLRIFITSRPEIPIFDGFKRISGGVYQDFILHNIPLSKVSEDISIFFQEKLSLVKVKHELETPWPDEQTIERLVEKAAGLFIYAATTCRFIQDGEDGPQTALSIILGADTTDTTGTTTPTKHLDDIYKTLLQHSVIGKQGRQGSERMVERFRQVVGSIVIMFNIMPARNLAVLLQMEVSVILSSLHSVLNIPKDENKPVRLFHQSFRDFLLDPQRSFDPQRCATLQKCVDFRRCIHPQFWIDEKEGHISLFRNCMRLISKLRKNICDLPELGTLVSEVTKETIQRHIPEHTQYACQYWSHHFERSDPSVQDLGLILSFLKQDFLHWLEALSLIGEIPNGVLMVRALERFLTGNSRANSELLELAYDAKRFILHNRSTVQVTPLQIYHAGLLFTPNACLIRILYFKKLPWSLKKPEAVYTWSPLIQTLEGHTKNITSVVFSRDGKLVASGSKDNTVRLWNTFTGNSFQVLRGHTNEVTSAVFSPDGKRVASGSKDNTVRLWDTSTGFSFPIAGGHTAYVKSVIFSPDGKLVASGSGDFTIRLWDTFTGSSLHVLKGHHGVVGSVVFSPDPDGKLVASGSWDNTVRLWHTSSGDLFQVLEGHTNIVTSVVFSRDGKLVASGSYDNTVRLWDTDTGKLFQILRGHTNAVTSVVFSPDGDFVASGANDDTVRLWNTFTGDLFQDVKRHTAYVASVVFSPNGTHVASGSGDMTIKLWDTVTGDLLQVLAGHTDSVTSVVFSPDYDRGLKLVASGSIDHTVKLWDTFIKSSFQVSEKHTNEEHTKGVTSVVFSPDGKLIASGSYDKTVRLWNTFTGNSFQVLRAHTGYISLVEFSPDGRLLASGSQDHTIRMWDIFAGNSLQVLKGHDRCISSVVFSPDAKLIASGSWDSTIRLWDILTGNPLQILNQHTNGVTSVAFSHDGNHIVSGSWDNTVIVWNRSTEYSFQVLSGHRREVTSVGFSPDGKLVASGSKDHTIRLWDIDRGTTIEIIDIRGIPNIKTMKFSNDGRHIHTNSGVVQINSYARRGHDSELTPTIPLILVTDQWVKYNLKNLLWLPVDYRPTSVAVNGNYIVMGGHTGRITILSLDASSLPDTYNYLPPAGHIVTEGETPGVNEQFQSALEESESDADEES